MKAEQEIAIIVEKLTQGSALIKRLEKTRTFSKDWPELKIIKDHLDEAIECLEEFRIRIPKEV